MAKINSLEDSDRKAHEATQGLFVKLENDGDKVIGVFRLHDEKGNLCIDAKDSIWNEKTNKTEDYNPQLHAGKNPSTKFSFNMFVIKAGNGKNVFDVNAPKIWSPSSKTYKLARTAMDKYCAAKNPDGSRRFDDVVFEVERKGAKGDTNTTYSVLSENPMKVSDYPGLAELVKAAKFNDVEKHDDSDNQPAQTNGSTQNGSSQQQQTVPTTISENDAVAIMTRLKALPNTRELAEKVLNKFGVQRVRDLKANDVAAANAFVDELSGKPAAAPAVVDPFA